MPRCHKKVHGKLPTGKSTKTCYGPKVQAVVVYLYAVHSMPYNRIAEFMRDVFSIESFSEGTVKNILSRNKSKAQVVYYALLGYIAKEKCAGMDETGVYINKTLCWIQNIEDAESRGAYRKVDEQPSDFALFIDHPHPDLGSVLRENSIF